MKPRRILIFSLVYYPHAVGGAEVAIKEITDRISPEEIQFDMITLRLDSRLPRYEKIGNVNVYRIGWGGKGQYASDSLPWHINLNKYAYLAAGFLRALGLHRLEPYDTIWSVMASYNSFAALFFKVCHPKIPFLLTLQEGDPPEYIERRARPLWPLFKRVFARADHIQAISTFLAKWASKMGAKCPISVVPNAADFALFSKPIAPAQAESLKRRLTKGPNDIFLVTTSRLVAKNAVGDAIEALQYLPKEVKFLILGQGHEEDALKKKAEKLGMAGRVNFLGYVPHADMPPYLQVSDIFVRPALSEGLGNSFLEAMAAGIPVIATAVGGIPDFLKDGETGLFCEIGNPRSIAQKVEKLVKDRESREYIVRNARNMVMEKYQWQRIAAEMKKIFGSLAMGYNRLS